AGNRRIGRVRGRYSLVAGGPERGDEVAAAVAQGAVGRQGSLTVAAREVNRAGVARGGVVELVLSRDDESEVQAGRGGGRSEDGKVSCRRGIDQNAVARGDGRNGGIRGCNGLAAGGYERDIEAGGAVAQSAVGRQSRL